MKKIRYFYILFIGLLISQNTFVNAQGVGINDSNNPPDPSSILDASSSNKGVLIPRITTAQRDAITNPAQSLLIFNTTTNCFETYVIGIWQNLWCSCSPPAAPLTGTHNPSSTQIAWNWNTASGATGYKWGTTNVYSAATDIGASTSYTQTGLICNTGYTLYVWAYNGCGNSSYTTLTQTTSACAFPCGNNVSFTYRGSTVTYGSVVGQNGTCWLDRNLGASQVATAYNDANGYGDLFEWGRGDDGHQLRTSSTTTTLSSTDIPGHSNFITNSTAPSDWRSPQNNNLWQGATGINNPCPSGWRLPSGTELDNERLSWSSNNSAGAFASLLKWTTAGYRYDTGVLAMVGSSVVYWSSTVNGTTNDALFFNTSNALMIGTTRASGRSVRCIKD